MSRVRATARKMSAHSRSTLVVDFAEVVEAAERDIPRSKAGNGLTAGSWLAGHSSQKQSGRRMDCSE